MKIYDVNQKPFINLLLYADPGVGKTAFAAGAQQHPDLADVLFANIEGGMLTISGTGARAVDIDSMAGLEELFWLFANRNAEVAKFKTLVIDSGSELQTLDLQRLGRREWEAEQKLPADRRKRENQDVLFQADYGENTQHMKRLFRWLKDAPINVIVTAHAKRIYAKTTSRDAEPELLRVVPNFTEKLGVSLMGFADFVWYMYTEQEERPGAAPEVRRCLLTQTVGKFAAKTRGLEFAKALGPVVKDPKLHDIYDLLLKTQGFKKGT